MYNNLDYSLLGFDLEEAAVNVVALFNDYWCLGLINCEPVQSEFVFPIQFKLVK